MFAFTQWPVPNFLAQSISMNAIMQVCLFKETYAFGTVIYFCNFLKMSCLYKKKKKKNYKKLFLKKKDFKV